MKIARTCVCLAVGALLSLNACSGGQQARRNALGTAVSEGQRHVDAARERARTASWEEAQTRAITTLDQLEALEAAVEAWMISARDGLGAIRQTDRVAVDELLTSLQTLRTHVEETRPLLHAVFGAQGPWPRLLDETLASAQELLASRAGGYARDHHVGYETMIERYQAWIEEGERAFERLREDPSALVVP